MYCVEVVILNLVRPIGKSSYMTSFESVISITIVMIYFMILVVGVIMPTFSIENLLGGFMPEEPLIVKLVDQAA